MEFLVCSECDNWDFFGIISNTSYSGNEKVTCKRCGKTNRICNLKRIEENEKVLIRDMCPICGTEYDNIDTAINCCL